MNESQCTYFPTELGWMAIIVESKRLKRVLVGYQSQLAAETAIDTLDEEYITISPDDGLVCSFVDGITDYAAGEKVSFSKWKLAPRRLTPFQDRVLKECRKIRYGQTLSYGELAAIAGKPKAARAVGSVMSNNTVPIVIPCHRVVAANKKLGGFSSPRGTSMKVDMLKMEGIDYAPQKKQARVIEC